ncbi:MAG: TniQ family protein [Snowella sp.]|nr:TniQ family protein [Snowella sp.]
MMEIQEIQAWWFLVEPLSGESISHFLGRFRRENELTVSMMGQLTKLGGAIARWEKFRFNPPPSRQQLEALAELVGVDTDRLEQMCPPAGIGMKMEPIRLCAACYVESPCHKIEWQFKETQGCDRHKLTLLSECPNCGARFKIPSLWVDGWCHRCFLPFQDMAKYQKNFQSPSFN